MKVSDTILHLLEGVAISEEISENVSNKVLDNCEIAECCVCAYWSAKIGWVTASDVKLCECVVLPHNMVGNAIDVDCIEIDEKEENELYFEYQQGEQFGAIAVRKGGSIYECFVVSGNEVSVFVGDKRYFADMIDFILK